MEGFEDGHEPQNASEEAAGVHGRQSAHLLGPEQVLQLAFARKLGRLIFRAQTMYVVYTFPDQGGS